MTVASKSSEGWGTQLWWCSTELISCLWLFGGNRSKVSRSLSDPASSQITGGMEQVEFGGRILEKKWRSYTALHCSSRLLHLAIVMHGLAANAWALQPEVTADCSHSSTEVIYSQILHGCFWRPPVSFYPSGFFSKWLVDQTEVWSLQVAVSSEIRDLWGHCQFRCHLTSSRCGTYLGCTTLGKRKMGSIS